MGRSWAAGYVADLPYTHGYYHELAPSFVRFALLLQGLDHGGGDASNAGRYRYCELGYGQGVSGNLHAAANPRGSFWGTDFLPEHALFAQDLAQRAGLDARWLSRSFQDLLAEDLPEFDFVTLHGVWSWIDADARAAVVEFLRRRLKVGGVVYLSCNVMPGWASEKPLRDLMHLHTELASPPGDPTASRIRRSVDFADRLRQGRAAFFAHHPPAVQMLEDLQRDEVQVVAHEYFNRSWHIGYFADVARALEPAGLQFACSAHKSDLVGEVQQRAQGRGLDGLDPTLRETAHDFILNRRFRRDLFVRGARRLLPAEREQRLLDLSFVLLRPGAGGQSTVQTPYGSVALDPQVLRPLLAALEAASAPLPLRQLRDEAGLAEVAIEQLLHVLVALVAQGHVFPAFADDTGHAGASRARAINRVVAERARQDDLLRYLASPLTGHAFEASRPERLMLAAWEDGARDPVALAEALRQASPGSELGLGSGDAQATPLGEAERFLARVAPAWQRLGLMDHPLA
ncbi:MAG: class I SAM-dependent methyltransferase [Ramlibacter sp.]|jgi:SAM-dependent methyltransferase|uniref:class I SAM-dependent methyltransferase n=1 Tax=Ramlibacter sp. TaxID=1917967 RepID=UPI0026372498|nr:class I SAM-dependent methyltransferase [Ramlibacter sp.]MDH4375696.1 class I SAM-dependent methyltransferase [Ramlibacter sp.]